MAYIGHIDSIKNIVLLIIKFKYILLDHNAI